MEIINEFSKVSGFNTYKNKLFPYFDNEASARSLGLYFNELINILLINVFRILIFNVVIDSDYLP